MKPLVPFTFYPTYLTAILPIMLMLPLSEAYASENPPATTVIAISAPVSPPVTPNSVTAQTRDQIAKIVFDDNFSKKTQSKVWKEKHPKQKPTPSWLQKWLENFFKNKPTSSSSNASDTASLMGLIAKILALLALLAAMVWIAKNAQTWLAWFSWIKTRRANSRPDPKIASHYRQAFAPLWQGLPDKSTLSQFVKVTATQGDWLLALSTLYRGTLREIVDIYDLPITRATTEHQNAWLLQKRTAQPAETAFFQELIALWSNVAYGQFRPQTADSDQTATFTQTIHQLASTWDSLYLNRVSTLEKRYQSLDGLNGLDGLDGLNNGETGKAKKSFGSDLGSPKPATNTKSALSKTGGR